MSAKSNNHTVHTLTLTKERNLFGAAAASALSSRTGAILLITCTRTFSLVRISNLLCLCLRARCASAFAGCTTTGTHISATTAGGLVRTRNLLDIGLVAIGTGAVARRTWTILC
jgi:hypothetical protein